MEMGMRRKSRTSKPHRSFSRSSGPMRAPTKQGPAWRMIYRGYSAVFRKDMGNEDAVLFYGGGLAVGGDEGGGQCGAGEGSFVAGDLLGSALSDDVAAA